MDLRLGVAKVAVQQLLGNSLSETLGRVWGDVFGLFVVVVLLTLLLCCVCVSMGLGCWMVGFGFGIGSGKGCSLYAFGQLTV